MYNFSYNNMGYYTGIPSCSGDTSKYLSFIRFNTGLPTQYSFKADIMFGSTAYQSGISVNQDFSIATTAKLNAVMHFANRNYGLIQRGGGASWQRTEGRLSINKWYTFEISFDGTTYTGTIYDGETVVGTWNFINLEVTPVDACIIWGEGSETVNFKNIKIKPL